MSHFEGRVDGQPHPLSPSGTQTVTRTGPHSFHIVSVAVGVTAERVCTMEEAGARFVCRGEASLGERKAPYVDSFIRKNAAAPAASGLTSVLAIQLACSGRPGRVAF